MSYSPKQWRAIARYCKVNDVKPALSAFPYLRFVQKDGTVDEVHISNITDMYDQEKEQSRRAKAQAKRKKVEV